MTVLRVTKSKRDHKSGYRRRSKTKAGLSILANRRKKGRKRLSCSQK